MGSYIPAPGISESAVKSIQSNFGGSSVLGLLNTFSGGGLGRIALFALGIMPYITASIILQLLQVVVPSLEKLSKEGEVGQAKITQYTRYLTVGGVCPVDRLRVPVPELREPGGRSADPRLQRGEGVPDRDLADRGHDAVMWMGELITQRGIGNGISLMIFASIVSRIPSGLTRGGTTPARCSR